MRRRQVDVAEDRFIRAQRADAGVLELPETSPSVLSSVGAMARIGVLEARRKCPLEDGQVPVAAVRPLRVLRIARAPRKQLTFGR